MTTILVSGLYVTSRRGVKGNTLALQVQADGGNVKDDKKAFGNDMIPNPTTPKDDPVKPAGKFWSTAVILAVLLVLCLIVLAGSFQYWMPLLMQRNENLASGIYLRAGSIYNHSNVHYDAANPPLAADVTQVEIDRKKGEAVFTLASGETVRAALGKAGRIQGCENQKSMEYFQLDPTVLKLSSTSFQNPILMAACGSAAAGMGGGAIPLGAIVLREGPLPSSQEFFMGVDCREAGLKCMYFGQAYGTLHVNFVDPKSGKSVERAHMTLSNELAVQEYDTAFDLPLYGGIDMVFKYSAGGVPEMEGVIHSSGSKLFIDIKISETRGYGPILDMPGYGKEIFYSFSLGIPADYLNEPTPYYVPTP